MSRSKVIKIIIPLLFTLALSLGFLQRDEISEYLKPQAAITYFKNASTDSLTGYYQKSQDLIRGSSEKKTATFLAVGDIMLSRNVAETMTKANDPLLPFSKMSDILKATDFNFANLESPFVETNPTIGGHSLVFGAPKEYVQGLVDYNFKVLNLANNHAMDKGTEGLSFTTDLLKKNNIKTTGAHSTLIDVWAPAIAEVNGIKICFVGASYASINDGGQTKNDYVARIGDSEQLKKMITYSKIQCDFVVATMHAGTEYTTKPNQSQINFAHTAIDAGADIVIGAHPHWVQTIERYNDKYIFYSLGNFIFDQEWSRETKEGLTLKIQISNSKAQNNLQGPKVPATLESIELIPVIIENYSTPRPATPEESKKILAKIGETETILK